MAGFNINDLLNAKSKGAAVQAEGPAEQEQEFKVTMLDVEDLMPSKDNFYSTENIDELAMSIELVGHIEQNLVVKPEAHGKYEVVAGHRRRLAALKLVQEGKEEYRKVPCLIKKESDTIKDKLSLIFTNATARQLTDWEKVQQAKELKEILTEYKKALQEENKDKPKEEREKMGRIRDIVAQMLNTSTTQVGRMEAIENNLSQEFKDELEKGNINISTAHELSRLDKDGQKQAYEKYEEKGELPALDKEYVITDEIEVTVDGYINFVTTGYLTFPAGETYAEVEAVCTTLGEDGNGFTPGQVSRLVTEEFLYFKEVANTTETAGGSGEESDTAYYNRMRESEESYTTAGPRGSYIYHAKAVSSQISDVSAESPQDGVADIRIMLYGGELPSEELIKEVQAYLSADDIRPMTDKVTVAAPTTVDFDIELTYYIPKDKEASTKEIKRAVDLAVESYELWQTSKMGRDINPSYFYAILMDSGIKRADIKKPVFTEIPKGSVAVLKKCTVTFGGVEDE